MRAQIELGKKLVPRVSYMTTHMGFASPFPEMQVLGTKLAAEYGLLLPRAARSLGHLYGSTDSGEARARKIAERLETLEPGTWILLDHAALDTPEMRAIHHPGYDERGYGSGLGDGKLDQRQGKRRHPAASDPSRRPRQPVVPVSFFCLVLFCLVRRDKKPI